MVGLCPCPVAVVMWWQVDGSAPRGLSFTLRGVGQIIQVNKWVFSALCPGSFPPFLIKAVAWAIPEPHSGTGQVTFGMGLKPSA